MNKVSYVNVTNKTTGVAETCAVNDAGAVHSADVTNVPTQALESAYTVDTTLTSSASAIPTSAAVYDYAAPLAYSATGTATISAPTAAISSGSVTFYKFGRFVAVVGYLQLASTQTSVLTLGTIPTGFYPYGQATIAGSHYSSLISQTPSTISIERLTFSSAGSIFLDGLAATGVCKFSGIYLGNA